MREGKFKFVLMCTSVLCVSAIEQSNQRIFAIPVASRCRRIVTFRVGVCVCAIVCSFGTAALCFFFCWHAICGIFIYVHIWFTRHPLDGIRAKTEKQYT